MPNRIDIGPDTEDSVDAYYYDSPFDRGTSLVFILKHDKHYISDIILTDRPIKDLQDSLGRYDLKEKRLSQKNIHRTFTKETLIKYNKTKLIYPILANEGDFHGYRCRSLKTLEVHCAGR